MFRMTLSCQSVYSRDGKGVFVKWARRMGGPGPVFTRYGESLLVGEPDAGVKYEGVVGWIPTLDAAILAGSGEWQAGRIACPESNVPED